MGGCETWLPAGAMDPRYLAQDEDKLADQALPAGWHPDPVGRHQYRYWDGNGWTSHVADNGVAAIDPVPARSSGADTGVSGAISALGTQLLAGGSGSAGSGIGGERQGRTGEREEDEVPSAVVAPESTSERRAIEDPAVRPELRRIIVHGVVWFLIGLALIGGHLGATAYVKRRTAWLDAAWDPGGGHCPVLLRWRQWRQRVGADRDCCVRVARPPPDRRRSRSGTPARRSTGARRSRSSLTRPILRTHRCGGSPTKRLGRCSRHGSCWRCGIGAVFYAGVNWRRHELMKSALSAGPWRSSSASITPSGKGWVVILTSVEPSVARFKVAGASRKSKLVSRAFEETVSWTGDVGSDVVVRTTESSALLRLHRLNNESAETPVVKDLAQPTPAPEGVTPDGDFVCGSCARVRNVA